MARRFFGCIFGCTANAAAQSPPNDRRPMSVIFVLINFLFAFFPADKLLQLGANCANFEMVAKMFGNT